MTGLEIQFGKKEAHKCHHTCLYFNLTEVLLDFKHRFVHVCLNAALKNKFNMSTVC